MTGDHPRNTAPMLSSQRCGANPRADNLFAVVSFLQHREGVRFQIKAARK
jgi:hypothetical protein